MLADGGGDGGGVGVGCLVCVNSTQFIIVMDVVEK